MSARSPATTDPGREAGGQLLYLRLSETPPDGIASRKGAFLLCSVWLVDSLALWSRLDAAMDRWQSLGARANPLGFLSQHIERCGGTFLGNFPWPSATSA